ncbi:ParB-like chromosome segregation protein Spo0J [Bradyrhizobium diazoefficiens]
MLDIYAEDGMSLEQLMAFTVTADHGRQEQVWQAISGSWQKEPYQIRRMLTEKTARASDRRAVFVGLDAYEAAGGVVLRDLFQSDDGGWLEDVALLDRLVAEKLKAEAETIAAEGWKWIEVAIDFPYGHTRGLRELDSVSAGLTAEEQATIEALKAEFARLESFAAIRLDRGLPPPSCRSYSAHNEKPRHESRGPVMPRRTSGRDDQATDCIWFLKKM